MDQVTGKTIITLEMDWSASESDYILALANLCVNMARMLSEGDGHDVITPKSDCKSWNWETTTDYNTCKVSMKVVSPRHKEGYIEKDDDDDDCDYFDNS